MVIQLFLVKEEILGHFFLGYFSCQFFFFFPLLAECGQLMNNPGNTVSDQIIAISQSGQNQQESEARIQSLLSQSISQSGTAAQGSMEVSQNMEKINDLLVSLHEPGGPLQRSF